MAGLKLKTPPAAEPVTLEEVKGQLRIDLDDTSYDDQLDRLITAAREWCEGYQNRAYITQTYELALDCWPHVRKMKLPRPVLQSIESLKYTDSDGNTVIWPNSNYFADDYSEPGYLVAKTCWPSVCLAPVNGIIVTYVAGYGNTAENVPVKIKQAIILLVKHWFEFGECDPPAAVTSLLNLDRVVLV